VIKQHRHSSASGNYTVQVIDELQHVACRLPILSKSQSILLLACMLFICLSLGESVWIHLYAEDGTQVAYEVTDDFPVSEDENLICARPMGKCNGEVPMCACTICSMQPTTRMTRMNWRVVKKKATLCENFCLMWAQYLLSSGGRRAGFRLCTPCVS
jgi:hypothetical protein